MNIFSLPFHTLCSGILCYFLSPFCGPVSFIIKFYIIFFLFVCVSRKNWLAFVVRASPRGACFLIEPSSPWKNNNFEAPLQFALCIAQNCCSFCIIYNKFITFLWFLILFKCILWWNLLQETRSLHYSHLVCRSIEGIYKYIKVANWKANCSWQCKKMFANLLQNHESFVS